MLVEFAYVRRAAIASSQLLLTVDADDLAVVEHEDVGLEASVSAEAVSCVDLSLQAVAKAERASMDRRFSKPSFV